MDYSIPELDARRYWYSCQYHEKAYDADTLRLWVDLGFRIWIHSEVIRLKDIDAWEVRGEERPLGLLGRDALRRMLEDASSIVIHTQREKRGKYGRIIADLYVDGLYVNGWLVQEKHAVLKEY